MEVKVNVNVYGVCVNDYASERRDQRESTLCPLCRPSHNQAA